MTLIFTRPVQNIFILVFILIAFYFTILGSYEGYATHSGWKIGDWLINYQGGFVRRGFIGEFIYKISLYSQINLGLIVFWVQISFYFLFFMFTYLSLIKHKSLEAYWLLIFSPFVFYFQVFDIAGGFRKEIIFIAILAFLVWSANKYETKKLERIFYITLLLYPLVILSHEMLALFLPYILIAYRVKIPLNKNRTLLLLSLLAISAMAFFLAIFNAGDKNTVISIISSLSALEYTPKAGAIDWLAKTLEHGLNLVKTGMEKFNYIKIFSVTIILSLLCFMPISYKLNKIFSDKINLFLLVVSILGSIALAAIAWDWGRFIYVNLVSLFLILLIIEDNELKSQYFTNWFFILLLIIVYFSVWHIPHCCGVQPVMRDINSTNIELLIKRFDS